MTRETAWEIVGGLSTPSKMPCYGYSLPASACKMGNLMSKNPNSICAKCYAKKGFYRFSNVKRSLSRRMKSLNHPLWVNAMITLVKPLQYFRWHDSGDIQDMTHFLNIVKVVKNTPNTMHWLPTREYGLVAEYVEKYGAFPDNLIVRLSASKFNGVAPIELAKRLHVQVSGASVTNFNCPASLQENACKDCRKCWDKKNFQINYKKH